MDDFQLASIKSTWLKCRKRPLYRTLYVMLREMILSGEAVGGMRIPPSRKFAELLDVSRNCVVHALENLQADGLLDSRIGAGVFVVEQIDLQFEKKNEAADNELVQLPPFAKRTQAWRHVKKRHHRLDGHRAFSPGVPALDHFPFDMWARLLSRRWRLKGARLAMEDDSAGYEPLRHEIAQYLKTTRGVNCTSKQVIIVSGAQQGLDLIARVMWEEGDRIVVEDPAFPGLDGVVLGNGCEIVPAALDQEGIILEPLQKEENLKAFLVTPSRNYPIGTTMSLSRRIELIRLAREKQAWIVEDDFDSEFRFDGPPLSSLQGLDNGGRTIYVGTFSRIIFPALRLGYIIVPERLVDTFVAAKSYIDGQTSIVNQAALADFFIEGYFVSHLRRMKKLYAERRAYLSDQLNRLMPDFCEMSQADGGLHVCLLFNKSMNDVTLVNELGECGTISRALSSFYRLSDKKQGLVLGYAGFDTAETNTGLQQLQKKILQK